jgi:hypothetical protein
VLQFVFKKFVALFAFEQLSVFGNFGLQVLLVGLEFGLLPNLFFKLLHMHYIVYVYLSLELFDYFVLPGIQLLRCGTLFLHELVN